MARDPALEAVLKLSPDRIGAALVALPESQWFDRKSIRIKAVHLAQTEMALANAEGGTVIVGIHGGRVEGTDAEPARRLFLTADSLTGWSRAVVGLTWILPNNC